MTFFAWNSDAVFNRVKSLTDIFWNMNNFEILFKGRKKLMLKQEIKSILQLPSEQIKLQAKLRLNIHMPLNVVNHQLYRRFKAQWFVNCSSSLLSFLNTALGFKPWNKIPDFLYKSNAISMLSVWRYFIFVLW